MTPAAALLEEARAHGITVEPAGEYIRIRPADACPEGLKARLREHKAEVLTLLATPTTDPPPEPPEAPAPTALSSPWPSPWPATLTGFGPKHTIPYSPCEVCITAPFPDEIITIGGRPFTVPARTGTWVSYGTVPLCLRHARHAAEPWA